MDKITKSVVGKGEPALAHQTTPYRRDDGRIKNSLGRRESD